MKTITLIVFFMIVVYASFAQETGYLVTVQKMDSKMECHKLTSPEQVDSIMNTLSTKLFNETSILLSNSLFYEIRTKRYIFYCEKKEILRIRNGEIKFKKIKKQKYLNEMNNTGDKVAKLYN